MAELKAAPCPICGKQAFVMHDTIPEADFGWSAGCPSMCIDDGIHGITPDSLSEDVPKIMYALSKQDAIKQWNCWVENWNRRVGEDGN